MNKKTILLLLTLSFMVSCKTNLINKTNPKDESISLKSSFENNFFIGAAINDTQILELDQVAISIIKNQFNTISPENSLKWMFLQPKPGVFYFDVSDKYVAFGEKNNLHIVGHTLVWHSQLADFMNEVKDSTTMAYHLKNHINTVVNRYKGRIHSWDVVNEALNEDGTLRKSVFYTILGNNYIENAFKLAEKADPKAELAYNDYNLCYPKKRNGAIKLIKKIQQSGAKIDAIGIQGHWQLNSPSLEEIEKSIIAFSELGVKVMFTELDISVLPNPWKLVGAEVNQNFKKFEGDKKMNPYPNKLPDSVQLQLTKRYEDIFNLFLKHQDKISRVTFWGVTDKDSWLNDWPIKGRTNYPLLFDRMNQPKPAYSSLINLKK
ncbi:MAG: 1,4-beta-xylanase [Cryomorphaceae bacterium BACL22 MAG-120619-bin32]|jgi:endo-1,4-beta-xylanase|nr:MAG: 1,4-beta-xylanase [Cryomorphaceae bacterium BACL22 MAG-120619-bin32]